MGSSPPPVIVVGAGLAGLSAALRLVAAGVDVLVLDPDGAGGKARTVEPQPGWTFEWGPHTFTHRAEPMFALVEELGLADRLVPCGENARARYLARDGHLQPARPLFGAIRPAELVAVLRGLFREAAPTDGETFHHWVSRVFSPGLADGPAGAATVGIWAARPQEIAIDAAFPALAAALRTHGTAWRAMRAGGGSTRKSGTYTLAGGLGGLAEAAAARVGDVVRERVTAVVPTATGWEVHTDQGVRGAAAVVIATEAPAAARLLAEVAPEAAAGLEAIRYSPLLVAHWLAREEDVALPHGFGWLAPPAEERDVLGTLFASDLRPGAAPAGARSFATMLGGTIDPAALDLDEQQIRARVQTEIEELSGRTPKIAAMQIVRHRQAVPLPEPGHPARVVRILSALPPGLALAGAWCGMGAMHEGIAAGQAAATVVQAREGRRVA